MNDTDSDSVVLPASLQNPLVWFNPHQKMSMYHSWLGSNNPPDPMKFAKKDGRR